MDATIPSGAFSTISDQSLYLQKCRLLVDQLQQSIDAIMSYLMSGYAVSQGQWRELLKALTQAALMQEYLLGERVTLVEIAESFLRQFDEWLLEVNRLLAHQG